MIMNKLYNSTNSRYFDIMHDLLTEDSLSINEIYSIVDNKGFLESSINLIPKLTESNLYISKNNEYFSILKDKPIKMISTYEKEWFKNMLEDEKISMFLSNDLIVNLRNRFKDINNFFEEEHFSLIDVFDEVNDCKNIVRSLLNSIRDKKVIKLLYESNKGKKINTYFIATDIIYSGKSDKFQVSLVSIDDFNNLSQEFSFL